MAFKKGQSGNLKGRPKGAVSQTLALKNLLEEVFLENSAKAKEMLIEMFDDPRDFRRLCELKASFEIKQIPQKLEGSGPEGEFLITYLPNHKQDA